MVPRTTGCIQAAPDRICALEHDLHRNEQAQTAPAGGRESCEAAGTIRACPPCAPCAAADIPPKPFSNLSGKVGVAKNYSVSDVSLLEACVRDDLNKHSLRRMAVIKPLKVVIDNYPDDQTEEMDAVNNPEDPSAGTRKVPFSKVLYIEQDDFRETPPPKYYRLFPGNEVRLRYAYFIKCTHVVKDDKGEVIEVHATYDPTTRGGDSADGRKVKSTIHWVSAAHAKEAEIRMYDRLFTKEDPEEGDEGFLACHQPEFADHFHWICRTVSCFIQSW